MVKKASTENQQDVCW